MPDRLHHLLNDLPLFLLTVTGLLLVGIHRARLGRPATGLAVAGLGAVAAALLLTQVWLQLFVRSYRAANSEADYLQAGRWLDTAVATLYATGMVLLVLAAIAAGRAAHAGWPPPNPHPGIPPGAAPPWGAPPPLSAPPPWGPPPSWSPPPPGPSGPTPPHGGGWAPPMSDGPRG